MKIGILYYGALHKYFKNKENIVNGPLINVRLSGVSFIANPNEIRLVRNISPYAPLIKSKIIILNVSNINTIITKICKKEYYTVGDIEPLSYLKKKTNGNYSFKMPIYENSKKYYEMVNYLYDKLIIYSKKYNLDYIIFISYIDRTENYNILNNISIKKFDKEIIKLLSNPNNKIMLENTKKYLLKCNPDSLSMTDKLILNL